MTRDDSLVRSSSERKWFCCCCAAARPATTAARGRQAVPRQWVGRSPCPCCPRPPPATPRACAHSPPLIPGRLALLLDLGLLADAVKPLLPLARASSLTSRFPTASAAGMAGPLAPLNHNNLFCDLTKEVILIRGRRHDLGLRPHITLITCFVENEESYPYPYFLRREVWQCLPDKSMPKHHDL